MSVTQNRHLACCLLLAAMAINPSATRAQQPVSPEVASASHEALTFFEGTWTTSDAKPEDDFKETCGWLPAGRRHMVCHSRWQTTQGRREGMSIFSFEPSSGQFLYTGFRPSGAVVNQVGQRLPNGWQFSSERGSGADRVQSRVTIERTTPDRFSFLSESAKGDGPWVAGAKFDYIRLAR